MTTGEHETYTIELRSEPGDSRPVAVRLRRLLKFALRSCRLRCVGIEQSHEPAETPNEQERTRTGAIP